MAHEFLIDAKDRGWCCYDCPGIEDPHWEGELPEEYWRKERTEKPGEFIQDAIELIHVQIP